MKSLIKNIYVVSTFVLMASCAHQNGNRNLASEEDGDKMVQAIVCHNTASLQQGPNQCDDYRISFDYSSYYGRTSPYASLHEFNADQPQNSCGHVTYLELSDFNSKIVATKGESSSSNGLDLATKTAAKLTIDLNTGAGELKRKTWKGVGALVSWKKEVLSDCKLVEVPYFAH